MKGIKYLIILSFSLCISNVKAQIDLEKIWSSYNYLPEQIPGFNFMKDGRHYSRLVNNTILKYDISNGQLVDEIFVGKDFQDQEGFDGTISAYSFSEDEKYLILENKRIYVNGSPDRGLNYQELVSASIEKRRGDPIIGEGHWRTMRDEPFHPSLATTKGRWSENYAFDAQVAEVEVDIETGKGRLIRAVTAHDCGFPIT